MSQGHECTNDPTAQASLDNGRTTIFIGMLAFWSLSELRVSLCELRTSRPEPWSFGCQTSCAHLAGGHSRFKAASVMTSAGDWSLLEPSIFNGTGPHALDGTSYAKGSSVLSMPRNCHSKIGQEVCHFIIRGNRDHPQIDTDNLL